MTFTGRVPDAELLEMLNTADICVNPDRANDMNDRSTMNKIMEYMALGKPVVQFDLTEGRVSAGDASWYARPNDVADLAQKMVALLGDEPLRIHMGAIGRERIEHVLSWQHEAPRLLAAYEHLTLENEHEEVADGLLRHHGAGLGHQASGAGSQLHRQARRPVVDQRLEGAGPADVRRWCVPMARSPFRWWARWTPRARRWRISTRR